MSVTVLITTRGRADSLRRTVESLLVPTNLEAGNWEALIVSDFDAHDGSLEVCEEFAAKFPSHFRFLVQQTTGKSNAVNLGFAEANGDIIALTDDDVLVAPDYIRSIRTVFEQNSADAAQGRIILDCEGELPRWMGRRQLEFMSWCDHGDAVQDWTHRTLYGTNMVVRTRAARAVGGFSLELGAGSVVGFAEDTEFSLRLRNAGYKFIYAPQILVRHQLPRDRLTRSFFRKRYFRLGRSKAYYILPLPNVPLWRYGLYSAKYAVLKEIEALWHRCANRPAEAMDCQTDAAENAGFFLQHLLFRLGEPRQLSRVTDWQEQSCSSPKPSRHGNEQLSNRPLEAGIPEATPCDGCDHEAKPQTGPLIPKVSIIIPTYNCEAFVEDCIRSVTNQSERDIEIIVVDDGSTDGTMSILEKLASHDSRIFLHSRPNSGHPGTTRNQGLSHARGKYVAFLDGDDLYHPEKIQRILSAFEAFPETDVVFHDLFRLETHPEKGGAASFLTNTSFLKLAADYLIEAGHAVYLCRENLYSFVSLQFIPFHTSAIAFRKDLLLTEPVRFREDLRSGEDQDLWLRLAKNRRFTFVNEALSFYRQRSGSITSDQVQCLLGSIQLHRENLERGKEIFSERQVQLYRSKIARLLFNLGYAYYCRFRMKEARRAYKESLSADFRVNTLLAYWKTFLPRPVIARYRQVATQMW